MRLVGRATRVAVLVCALMGGGALFAPPASASTAFRVVTWNTAMGNSQYKGYYNEHIVEIVGYLQLNPSWQLSLQEACQNEAAQVAWYANSSGAGFTWFFGPGTPPGTISGSCGS